MSQGYVNKRTVDGVVGIDGSNISAFLARLHVIQHGTTFSILYPFELSMRSMPVYLKESFCLDLI